MRRTFTALALALIGASALVACERVAEPRAQGPAQQPIAAKVAPAAPPPAGPAAVAARMPAPETLADTFITGEVKAALMTDESLAGSDVSVNTNRGVVSLTGRVKSREQAAIASAHAQGEDGVMRVDNTVVVLAE